MAITYLDEAPKSKVTYLDAEPSLGGDFAQQKTSPLNQFLPGYEKTEKLISGRESSLSSLLETLRPAKSFKGSALQTLNPLRPLDIGLKTMGLLVERGEAGIANLLMKYQEEISNVWSGEMTSGELFKEMISETKKGIAGERLGELGDLPRRAGVAEPISAAIGLFSLAGITDVVTRGFVQKAWSKGGNFLKSKIPKVMNKNYVINRARVAADGLDDLYRGLSREYDDVYNKIGNKRVALQKLQDIVDDLPQNVINKLKSNKLLVRAVDDSIEPTLSNVKIMKNIIRKSIPNNVLNGSKQADIIQGDLKYNIRKINDLMAEGNPELIKLNKQYREFMQMNDSLKGVLFDRQIGTVKAEGLKNLFSTKGARHKQMFFDKFAKAYPKAAQIMKDIVKYNRRQAVKKGVGIFAKRAAYIGGGYYGARKLLNMFTGEIGGGGGASEK